MLCLAIAAALGPGPAVCPGPARHRERIEAHLGRELAPGELVITVAIRAQEAGHYIGDVDLTIRGRSFRRRLLAESCDAIYDAAALVAAASLADEPAPDVVPDAPAPAAAPDAEPARPDASRVSPSARPAPAPRAREGRGQTATPAEPAPVAPARGRGAPWRVALGVGAGAGVGGPPIATGVVEVDVGLRRRWAEFGVAGAYWVRRRIPGSGRAAIVELGTASVWGCAAFGPRLRGGPCLAFEAGGMRGQFVDDRETARTTPWLAGRIGGKLEFLATQGVALSLAGDLGVAVVRPRFELGVRDGPAQVVFAPGLLSGRVLFRVRLLLPVHKSG